MRTSLLIPALLCLVVAPLAARAAGATPSPARSNVIVAQSTALQSLTVTAPSAARINDPWHISTWRFHAGPNPYQPAQGAWCLSGGGMREGGFGP